MRASWLLLTVVAVLVPRLGQAHCDALDGPVAKTAQKALESGNVNPALAWVKPDGEADVKAAFAKARKVRQGNADARELADRWFLETLVRVHRAGEGAPYTGLKPAGQDLGPAIPAADRAVQSGKPEEVLALLGDGAKEGVTHRLARLRALPPPGDDVVQGRAYVAAYVDFLHYVQGVHTALQGAHGHEE